MYHVLVQGSLRTERRRIVATGQLKTTDQTDREDWTTIGISSMSRQTSGLPILNAEEINSIRNKIISANIPLNVFSAHLGSHLLHLSEVAAVSFSSYS